MLSLDVAASLDPPPQAMPAPRHGRPGRAESMSARDLEHVDGWSLSVDVQLLLKTPAAVMGGEGAR